jgi:hypothetical protein
MSSILYANISIRKATLDMQCFVCSDFSFVPPHEFQHVPLLLAMKE